MFIFLSSVVVRNFILFSKYYKIPNNDIITPIGFKSNYNMWKVVYNENYQQFVKSYNEPLLILNPVEPPLIYKTVYENEIKDVEELFFFYNKYQILKKEDLISL